MTGWFTPTECGLTRAERPWITWDEADAEGECADGIPLPLEGVGVERCPAGLRYVTITCDVCRPRNDGSGGALTIARAWPDPKRGWVIGGTSAGPMERRAVLTRQAIVDSQDRERQRLSSLGLPPDEMERRTRNLSGLMDRKHPVTSVIYRGYVDGEPVNWGGSIPPGEVSRVTRWAVAFHCPGSGCRGEAKFADRRPLHRALEAIASVGDRERVQLATLRRIYGHYRPRSGGQV